MFITASGEDAAQAAMNYGKINWLVHTALAVLYNTVKLDVKKIDITADFTSGKTEYEFFVQSETEARNSHRVCLVGFIQNSKSIFEDKFKECK